MKYECKLSEDLQKIAKEELNEDSDRRAADIEHIRQWINKQPHLNARTDDWSILRFLRGCKFSLEKTKQKIDTFYTIRTMLPEWFNNRDPQNKKLREVLELGVILPLMDTDDKGRRIVMSRNGVYDPHKFPMDDLMKACYMLIDVLIEVDERSSLVGVVNVLDMDGFTSSHMLAFPMTAIKKSMVLWQDAYYMRFKGLHYINTSSTFETMFNLVKGFMKEKMKKRITVHSGDHAKFYEAVPKRVLPKEYGGENTVQEMVDYWMKIIDEKRDWILEDDKYRVDESKRPGKPKTTNDLFGLEGSFRKLNVD